MAIEFRTADYVRADGSVVVPPEVAEPLLQLAAFGVAATVRRNMRVRKSLLVVLDALQVAAIAEDSRGSDHGTTADGSITLGVADELITVSTAASRMGCSTRAITKAIAARRLPASRVGRVYLIRATDFEKYRHGLREAS